LNDFLQRFRAWQRCRRSEVTDGLNGMRTFQDAFSHVLGIERREPPVVRAPPLKERRRPLGTHQPRSTMRGCAEQQMSDFVRRHASEQRAGVDA